MGPPSGSAEWKRAVLARADSILLARRVLRTPEETEETSEGDGGDGGEEWTGVKEEEEDEAEGQEAEDPREIAEEEAKEKAKEEEAVSSTPGAGIVPDHVTNSGGSDTQRSLADLLCDTVNNLVAARQRQR